ncbi:MAG: PKD domain-containing protein [Bacteroidetes bacterium]|nr:PKD domain-containing protein [Bacteroidota bacterium]
MAITFNNTSANATSYIWNFGDGTTSTQVSPSHNYTTAGSYMVTLIASNANGCTDTLQFSYPIVVLQSPAANFTRTPASGCTPLTVFFNSNSTQLLNPTYLYNFGNGQFSSSPSANMIF